MPNRIQRQRKAGWRKPAGAVYVGRGSRWGNPFAVGALYASRTCFHDAPVLAKPSQQPGTIEHAAWSPWPAWTETVGAVRDRAHAAELFAAHVTYFDDTWDLEEIRRELGGRDLMCWCPTPAPGEADHCHAAVLIALANEKEPARA